MHHFTQWILDHVVSYSPGGLPGLSRNAALAGLRNALGSMRVIDGSVSVPVADSGNGMCFGLTASAIPIEDRPRVREMLEQAIQEWE